MSKKNLHSPWLEQLQRTRPAVALQQSLRTDICIVGGGIAGLATAYYTLTNTNRHVVLIEAERIAHGATGHNAGQLVSYFEKPFHNIVHEFGIELAAEGQRSIDHVWRLLDDIRADLDIDTPCDIFTGYAGILDRNTLLDRLEAYALKKKAGLEFAKILIAQERVTSLKLPSKYKSLFTTIPHAHVLELLQTRDDRYVAVIPSKKGCMNSARFTEEVAEKLLVRFGSRFSIYEHSPVSHLELHETHAVMASGNFDIHAKRVVLCTNGFERIHIVNTRGGNIETKFHHLVRGAVGYMAAFIEPEQGAPTAISYLPEGQKAADVQHSTPYVYMTRRRHTFGEGEYRRQSLICLGGPESLMDDTNHYSKEHPYPAEAEKSLRAFLKKTYKNQGRLPAYQYLWHGLMGYTPNGLRCIGAEPCNPVLLYNLGCNGVGLLPSIYGGLRISQILRGDKLSPSIFDPQDQRCLLPSEADTKLANLDGRKRGLRILASLSIFALIVASATVLQMLK